MFFIFAIKFQTPATIIFNDIIDFNNDLMFFFIFILIIILTFLIVSSLLYTGIAIDKKFGYASKIDSHPFLEVTWTIIPFILIIWFVFPGIALLYDSNTPLSNQH